ncbi:MAG: nuclear transport factor 2 family protein, partial [Anaerolineales bacterium]|nr:nuclear transport factor 2 family protein [Anaerolineales bacterium]
YLTALRKGDTAAMGALRCPDFALDWVHSDAFANTPLTQTETSRFWRPWFAAFSEMDYEATRTIAAESVVVVQWVFTGTQDQPLGPPIFIPVLEATGKTISIRGVSIYDIHDGMIQKETMYIDLATLWVELGVTP